MQIGYRVVSPRDVGRWDGDFVQISVYGSVWNSLGTMEDIARVCRDGGVSYVIHPVGYGVLDDIGTLREMARLADMALILHDERAPGGGRLGGRYEARFRDHVEELKALARISFENAMDTADAPWFWSNFAESVTVDIGHMEAAGFNSVEFVAGLSDEIVSKVEFVHMHCNRTLRGGLTDHWPLSPGCREMSALQEVLRRKSDLGVILEINETEEMARSIELLEGLRAEHGL